MTTTTTTTDDLMDSCRAAHDALQEVFYRLDDYPLDTDAILQALSEVEDAAQELDQARKHVVAILRGRDYTWQMIGDLYGVTRQAAQQYYG